MKKLVALMMVLAMLMSVAALGETFVMGIDAEYPPFSYIGDDGEYTGFDVDVCKAVCDRLGWKFDVFPVNWPEKLVQLDAYECDCVWSGMTILDSMKKGYVLSAPYYQSTQVLVVKEDSGLTTAAQLAGKIVAVQLGTSGEALLNDELADWASTFEQVLTCESFLVCFTELGGGAVDAVFVDMPVAVEFVDTNEGFALIDENLGAEDYGIAFRKTDAEKCTKVEEVLNQMVADGTYAQIAAKYYPSVVTDKLYLLNSAE